jgi:L-iditol 2-dehydrogenase
MTEPGAIELREAERPAPGEGEIVMRTRRIGICGSDLHVYHGLHPYTGYPVVQGHEVSGVIAEIGPGVDDLAPGDHVTFMPQLTCGECYSCRHGMSHICESLRVMGFQAPGAAQEFVALDAANVLPLPPGMPLDHGALIEPIAVAVHALRRGGGAVGRRILVLGAGPIGNLTAQVAAASGAEAVLVTDLSPYRLDKARECGLQTAIDPSATDLAEVIDQEFGPDGADLIMECVGAQATAEEAITRARRGSTIVVVGVFGQKPTIDVGLIQDHELNLVGTLMYQRPDYERAIALAAAGQLTLEPLVTDHFPFEQYLAAYEKIESAGGETMKVMIALG